VLLSRCIGQGFEQEVHVDTEDDLIVELVLQGLSHIEDQLKTVIQKMVWVDQGLLNAPNQFLMRNCGCIKIFWWSLLHGQRVGGIFCYPICQPAGGYFFLNHTTAWIHCGAIQGAGDVERILRSFSGFQPKRRNFFLNWASPRINHGVGEVRR
jgi:hypothetical protein